MAGQETKRLGQRVGRRHVRRLPRRSRRTGAEPPRAARGRRRASTAGRLTGAIFALALVASLVPGSVGLAATDEQERLAEAEGRIDELTADLERLGERRNQRQAEVEAVAGRVAEVEQVLNDTLRRIDTQQARVDATARRVAETQRALDDVTAVLDERARSLFMGTTPTSLNVLLGAGGDVQDVLDRSGMLEAISVRGQITLEDLTAARTRLAQERRLLEDETQELAALRAEQESLLARVRETLFERRTELATVEARREALASEREDVEGESERLEALIRSRQQRRETSSAGPSPKTSVRTSVPSGSGYVWPLCRNVTSEYGPRWGRMHQGIDIDGVTGDALRAANDGVVIQAGWSGGYGLLTMIDHGDGVVTAYAHQSRVDVARGQQVSRGQTIGAVGATGNVTGDHLHYETRVGGRAVNPRTYLTSGC